MAESSRKSPAAAALVALVRLYQRLGSPALSAALGPNCGCRFTPTCSHYAVEAIRAHGALAGAGLALVRILKCTPLHKGGSDPVPQPKAKPTTRVVAAYSCTRVTL